MWTSVQDTIRVFAAPLPGDVPPDLLPPESVYITGVDAGRATTSTVLAALDRVGASEGVLLLERGGLCCPIALMCAALLDTMTTPSCVVDIDFPHGWHAARGQCMDEATTAGRPRIWSAMRRTILARHAALHATKERDILALRMLAGEPLLLPHLRHRVCGILEASNNWKARRGKRSKHGEKAPDVKAGGAAEVLV